MKIIPTKKYINKEHKMSTNVTVEIIIQMTPMSYEFVSLRKLKHVLNS